MDGTASYWRNSGREGARHASGVSFTGDKVSLTRDEVDFTGNEIAIQLPSAVLIFLGGVTPWVPPFLANWSKLKMPNTRYPGGA